MMCRKFFLAPVVIVLCATSVGFSQQMMLPGGVGDPLFWVKPRINGKAYYWENLTHTKENITGKKQSGTSLNFNPGIVFDNTPRSLTLPLGKESLRRQTIFLAYKVTDSLNEQFLWTINDPEKTVTVATNKRLVDLKRYSYKSYQEKFVPRKANIHFFQQNVTDSIATQSTLVIGQTSKPGELPPTEFKGSIGEIIVYNRVLSTPEVQRVASYLGIKYGISLSQYEIKNYLNSRGEIIWDIDKHKGFESSITGVGRDDGSGLLQVKSSNMFEEGLLTLELKSKSDEIPNNYFAFWSDNGKSLLVKKQDQGEPPGISREWQLDFTNPADLSLDWTFNPAFIINETLPIDTTYYWLWVDHSGKGTYDVTQSEYIRLNNTFSKEKLSVADFDWDKKKTGTVRFTLKVAPEMFSIVGITEASCGVQGSGQLNYTIEGGEGPFTVIVKKAGSESIVKEWTQTARSATGVTLESGTYDYIVRDKRGKQYAETLFVADRDGTPSTLQSNYVLQDGNPLLLDASKDLPEGNYQYQWFYEDNLVTDNPELRIDQPGDYELRLVNAQACKTAKKITVTSDGNEITDSGVVILYPNPTPDGRFAVAMQFPKKSNASISIYSSTGIVIREKHYHQIQAYIHEDRIDGVPGEYLVKVNSDFGIKTFKVILK